MTKPIIGSIIAAVILVVLGVSMYSNSAPAPSASDYGSATGSPTPATPIATTSPTTPVGSPTGGPVVTPKVTPTTPKPPATPPPPTKPAPNTFTMADVAAHGSASSCYTVVRGSVYDLSNWISQHPGGSQAIISMCGIDATDAFIAQHGGQRRPEAELVSFKIGTLAQ